MNHFTRKLKHYGLDDRHYPFGDSVLNAALIVLMSGCILFGFVSWNVVWWHGLSSMTTTDFSCPYTLVKTLLLFFLVVSVFAGCYFFSNQLMQQKKGNLWYLSLHLITLISVFMGAVVNTFFFAAISRYYGDSMLVFTQNYVTSYQLQYYAYIALALFSWVCLMKCRKPKEEDEIVVESTSGKLGGADYANKAYLHQKGMIPLYHEAIKGQGQILGKLDRDTYITLPNNVHSLMIAPPRSGKAVSGAIPLILDSDFAIWGWDMKGELFMSTWKECLRKGRSPIAFAPTGVINQYGDFRPYVTFNFNPLKTKFTMNAITREKYLDNLVKGLTADISHASSEKHFIDLSVPIIKVMVNDYLGTDKTLVDLYDELVNINLEKLIKRFKNLLQKNPDYRLVRSALGTLENTTERELSGIRNTYKRALDFLSNPIWTQCFSQDGLDFYDYAVGQNDVFMIIDQSTVESYPKVVRLFFSLLKSTFDMLPPKALVNHHYPIVLDEIAQVGPLEEIESIYELFGDKGVTLHLYFQNVDQIEKFKKAELLKGFALKQFFCVRDTKTIKWIQELSGKQTVLLNNVSHGSSTSKSRNFSQAFSTNHNKSHSSSESISETGTELFHTDFIRELSRDKQIVMYENIKPILCDRCFYYDDPRYTNRASTNFVFHRQQINLEAVQIAQDDFDAQFKRYETKPEALEHENTVVQLSRQSHSDDIQDSENTKELSRTLSVDNGFSTSNENLEAPTDHAENSLSEKYIDYHLDKAVELYLLGKEKGLKRKALLEQYNMSPYKYRLAKEEVQRRKVAQE